MKKPLPFTKASIRRAIEGVRSAGLRVTGVKPDGTVIVEDSGNSTGLVPSDADAKLDETPEELRELI